MKSLHTVRQRRVKTRNQGNVLMLVFRQNHPPPLHRPLPRQPNPHQILHNPMFYPSIPCRSLQKPSGALRNPCIKASC